MSSPAQNWSAEAERDVLESLRPQYEQQGFTFKIAPDRASLPEFLGNYVPDAIAQKGDRNIAIEVKRVQSRPTQAKIQEIRRLFDGHPDWQFTVVYAGPGPLESVTVPSASPNAIRTRLHEVRHLSEAGYPEAALVMAWSLLEAALQAVSERSEGKPRTPGTVVQTLAMNGYISPETERKVRELIQLRNRIVHGDVMAQPTAANVELVLQAVEDTLVAAAA